MKDEKEDECEFNVWLPFFECILFILHPFLLLH
jgi:hypothetical protein